MRNDRGQGKVLRLPPWQRHIKEELESKREISRSRKWRATRLWLTLLAPGAMWLGIVGAIDLSTRGAVFVRASQVPEAPVGIVFGAGLVSGRPSLVLRQRLDGAISLYRSHKVKRLLMSGDNRTFDYNEPKAMRTYAIKHSVDPNDIDLDFGGRDTYDTCYRAKRVFGIDKAVLITQRYHAPRALFLARSLGIDSVAYGVPNLDRYPSVQLNFTCREYVADLKALWDSTVSHRKPYVALGSQRRKSF